MRAFSPCRRIKIVLRSLFLSIEPLAFGWRFFFGGTIPFHREHSPFAGLIYPSFRQEQFFLRIREKQIFPFKLMLLWHEKEENPQYPAPEKDFWSHPFIRHFPKTPRKTRLRPKMPQAFPLRCPTATPIAKRECDPIHFALTRGLDTHLYRAFLLANPFIRSF